MTNKAERDRITKWAGMAMQGEEWRPITGYEGLYEVSSHGRVRSLDRVMERRNGKMVRVKGRAMTTNPNSNGYPCVGLSRRGCREFFRVHVLVLETFVAPRPEGYVAMHLDNVRDNNSLDNLKWGTHSENCTQPYTDGYHNTAVGVRVGGVKLNEEIVRRLREEYAAGGVTYKQLAQRYGVTRNTISNAVRRVNWRCVV